MCISRPCLFVWNAAFWSVKGHLLRYRRRSSVTAKAVFSHGKSARMYGRIPCFDVLRAVFHCVDDGCRYSVFSGCLVFTYISGVTKSNLA